MNSAVSRAAALVAASVLLVLPAQGVRAALLPVWNVDELAARSDLIVLGRRSAPNVIEIEKVLKGQWPGKTVTIGSLGGYTQSRPAGAKLEAPGKLLAFISLREHRRRIVANGLFREGTFGPRQGVFGHYQPMNPGGYVLRPLPAYTDLPSLRKAVRRAVAGIPARQQALLAKLRAAKNADQFRNALAKLGHITRMGDLAVLKAAAAVQQPTGMPKGEVLSLIRDVQEPRSWPLLKDIHERTKDAAVLPYLGRLGSFESRAYLKGLLWTAPNRDVRLYARYGLERLCVALRAEGRQRESDLIKADIYEAVDKKVVQGSRQEIRNAVGPAPTTQPATGPARRQ